MVNTYLILNALLLLSSSLAFVFKPSKLINLSKTVMSGSFYDIVEKDSKGVDFPFSNFKGKVVYGVNVASKCGYTASGYNLLSRIAALKDKGVVLD